MQGEQKKTKPVLEASISGSLVAVEMIVEINDDEELWHPELHCFISVFWGHLCAAVEVNNFLI